MKRKDILTKRMSRLEEKLAKLTARAEASENADEVRELTEQVEEVNAEIEETREELDAIEEEENQEETKEEERSVVPEGAKLVNASVASFETKLAEKKENRSMTETMEYRKAFMAYAQHGTLIPDEMRNGDATTAAENGAVIPVTVMNEVINTVRKRYGNLYAKVKKTNVKGGVEYPVGALQASFKWINESTVSPRQKAGTTAKISFAYHTAEIRVAQTFLSAIVSLEAFEQKLVELIAVAYLQAMDYGIINGTGDGQMTGILNDSRVTNTITMTANNMSDWKAWRKNFFAALPLGYRGGEFIFPVSTVDAYLETMADNNNNPIFRQATGLEVNDGDAINPNGRFFGRDISLVEPDIIADFDSASAGDVVGIYWQPEEYAINENFGFTMRRYFDEETNEWVNKALVVVDGKVLNPTGFYKIIKG